MSPYVWVVTQGELCQGGSVRGIFHKLDDAKRYVARELPEFRLDLEQPEHHVSYHDSSDWVKICAHLVY